MGGWRGGDRGLVEGLQDPQQPHEVEDGLPDHVPGPEGVGGPEALAVVGDPVAGHVDGSALDEDRVQEAHLEDVVEDLRRVVAPGLGPQQQGQEPENELLEPLGDILEDLQDSLRGEDGSVADGVDAHHRDAVAGQGVGRRDGLEVDAPGPGTVQGDGERRLVLRRGLGDAEDEGNLFPPDRGRARHQVDVEDLVLGGPEVRGLVGAEDAVVDVLEGELETGDLGFDEGRDAHQLGEAVAVEQVGIPDPGGDLDLEGGQPDRSDLVDLGGVVVPDPAEGALAVHPVGEGVEDVGDRLGGEGPGERDVRGPHADSRQVGQGGPDGVDLGAVGDEGEGLGGADRGPAPAPDPLGHDHHVLGLRSQGQDGPQDDRVRLLLVARDQLGGAVPVEVELVVGPEQQLLVHLAALEEARGLTPLVPAVGEGSEALAARRERVLRDVDREVRVALGVEGGESAAPVRCVRAQVHQEDRVAIGVLEAGHVAGHGRHVDRVIGTERHGHGGERPEAVEIGDRAPDALLEDGGREDPDVDPEAGGGRRVHHRGHVVGEGDLGGVGGEWIEDDVGAAVAARPETRLVPPLVPASPQGQQEERRRGARDGSWRSDAGHDRIPHAVIPTSCGCPPNGRETLEDGRSVLDVRSGTPVSLEFAPRADSDALRGLTTDLRESRGLGDPRDRDALVAAAEAGAFDAELDLGHGVVLDLRRVPGEVHDELVDRTEARGRHGRTPRGDEGARAVVGHAGATLDLESGPPLLGGRALEEEQEALDLDLLAVLVEDEIEGVLAQIEAVDPRPQEVPGAGGDER